jgi:hypothetical protein
VRVAHLTHEYRRRANAVNLVCLGLALLSLAPACVRPPAPVGPPLPLVPPSWLPAVPATHDPLSAVLGALGVPEPDRVRDGARMEVFSGYLEALAYSGPRTTPELFPSQPYVAAYLVNAHVAWTIALGESPGLRTRPTRDLHEIPFPVDGRTSTLATLEGEIARRAPFEPRFALFLNPGWKGGPPLPDSALEGHSLEWQLAAHAALCGRTPGFWGLDRRRKIVKISAFTELMWGLPEAQPARARHLLDLVSPPPQLSDAIVATCGPSLLRCTVTTVPFDRARLFAAGPLR